MSNLPVVVEHIDGKPRTVRGLFAGRHYGIDYYQREYTWTEANVLELLEDLASRFLASWDPDHERSAVKYYRPYFLGPIVTDDRSDMTFLVDGQQRVTTLSLLLIILYHLQPADHDRDKLKVLSLIISNQWDKDCFVLDVEERTPCMQAVLYGNVPDLSKANESTRNLWARYQDLERLFPEELKGPALPYFVDWLLERVLVVEITTTDQEMALDIFESMNDRGLRVTTTEMLKGYLLANIKDPVEIEQTNTFWKTRISELCGIEGKTETDFIKHWLRAKYAYTIRDRKKDAVPLDFDVIGTAPHKWIRDNKENIGLRKPGDYASFINRDFKGLSARYNQLLSAAQTYTPGFEEVYYNSWNGFTFQYPLILAAVTPVDDDVVFQAKTRLVAGYLDLFVARRMVNYHNFGYSTVAYSMFNLIKEIRNLDLEELVEVLSGQVAKLEDQFDAIAWYRLHQRNSSHMRYLLARLTAWIEQECKGTVTFADLVDRYRTDPYEIEHIWANHPERYPQCTTDQIFADQRNSFGGLLLLPKSFNASYNDNPYIDKIEHYYGQNHLARSLHPRCYEHNPQFDRLVSGYNLPFKPYPTDFDIAAMDDRLKLYQRLCETIWDPERLGLKVLEVEAGDTETQQTYHGVSLRQLIQANLVPIGSKLVGIRSGKEVTAVVTSECKIQVEDDEQFDSPSAAAARALDLKACNGWDFWRLVSPSGPVRLSRVRQDYTELMKSR